MKLNQRSIISVLLGIAILPLASCMKSESNELLTGVVVINVLEKELYDDCHIAGSLHVPFETIEAYARERISPHADIVIYCSNYLCSASGHSAKLLKKIGFNSVAAYEGGAAEWYQHKLPVVGPCKAEYLHKKNVKMGTDDESEFDIITVDELKQKLRIG